MSEIQAPPVRLAFLDSLRGLAATSVMVFHFGHFFEHAGVTPSPPGSWIIAGSRFGWLGVETFFVLSGFVIALTAPKDRTQTLQFLKRRLIRIVPPYWASIGSVVALYFVARTLGFGKAMLAPDPISVVANLGYLQRAFGLPHLQEIYWTLCLEIQFYLLFAVAIALGGRAGKALIAATFVASIASGFAGYDTDDWWVGHWHAFALGAATYYASRPGRSIVAWLVFLVPVLALGAYRERPAEFITAGTATALYLGVRLNGMGTWLAWPVLLWLGRISYSLYLTHSMLGVLVFSRLRGPLARGETGVWIIIALGIVNSVIGAYVFCRLFEVPAMRLSKRLTQPRAPVVSARVAGGELATADQRG
jgi:peptidoglycan/LPS O-acetylase OafA/YrhL